MTGMLTYLLVLCVALGIPGVIARTRAVMAGRKGVRFLQHIYTARTMLRKGVVTGHTTTLLFRTAPSVYLAALLVAALMMPVGELRPLISFNGDVVLFAYLFGLSRLVLVLAALDTGSSFEGMGASREALYGAMIEPVLFISAGTLALIGGNTSFFEIFQAVGARGLTPEYLIVILLVGYVLIKALTVEAGRVPVDDPRTHLELTMIHEVMILDYSGVDLAMITIGGWIKTALIALLAANTVTVAAGSGAVTVPLVVVAALATGLILGLLESVIARNKLIRNTTYIVTIVAMALVVFMVAFLLNLDISLL